MTEGDMRVGTPATAGSGGSLDKIKGIYLMSLSGSYEAMGEQMHDLSSSIVGDAMIAYYRNLPERLIAHSFAADISKSLPPMVAGALYSLFNRFASDKGNNRFDGFLRAYAAKAGIPPREAANFTLFADSLHYLAGRSFAPMAMPGCSGFFARGGATAGGRCIVGRNFDFFGRGLWDKHQTVLVLNPEDAQSYIWLGALGIPFGAFGINSAGIAVLPFTNFTKDVTVRGRLLYPMIIEIMETAQRLDDVVNIISRGKRTVGLSFLVVDSRARDARVVGFSANRFETLDPKDDVLARTNHYITDQMKENETAPTAWKRHSNARLSRIYSILQEKRGALTPEDAVAIMSDNTDPFEHRKRVVGDIVAASNNANSLVYLPDEDEIYIADGRFPVCHSEKFLGFRLSALFAGDAAAAPLGKDLPGGGHLNETEKEALELYEDAWTKYLDLFDTPEAVKSLRRAAELLPDEPIFHRVAGILLLKKGEFKEALVHLEINAAPNYRQNKLKAESRLWAGRCYDLLGIRDKALEYYKYALALDDPEITPSVRRAIDRPFRKKELNNVEVEFVTGGAIAKYH
jgi:tetratricopeptide (TPR) repeat protein